MKIDLPPGASPIGWVPHGRSEVRAVPPTGRPLSV